MQSGYLCCYRVLFLAWLALATLPGAVRAQTDHERALAAYDEGKLRYDAGDFVAARSKFNEAVRLEPDQARWHYNLALAQRQLGVFHAARESLLKARTLDPAYKRQEIDQKLEAMGFDRVTGNPRPPPDDGMPREFQIALILIFGIVLTSALLFIQSRRRPATTKGVAPEILRQKIDAAARPLVGVEHSLRFAENIDVRSRLERATRLEHGLRQRLGDTGYGAAGDIDGELAALAEAVRSAEDCARQVFGPNALSPGGKRRACYFCARPLANAEICRVVQVKRGESRDSVASCLDCASRAARGESLEILESADGKSHWTEVADFDPYAARHAGLPGMRRVPAWRHAPQRSLRELALLAAGSTLAGGALAMALRPEASGEMEPLLDLDAARDIGLAQEATRAAAKRAGAQRNESSSRDHS